MSSPSTLSEFYAGIGSSLPSISERAKIFASYGLGSADSYSGTAEQNTALLDLLVKASTPPDPLADIRQFESVLSQFTIGDVLAFASDTTLVAEALKASGVGQGDFDRGVAELRAYPSSMSLWAVFADLVGKSPTQSGSGTGSASVPEPLKWKSADVSKPGVYESPAFTFDDKGNWSVRDLAPDALKNLSADDLKKISGAGWQAFKDGMVSEVTNQIVDYLESKLPAPLFNMLNSTYGAASDAETVKDVVGSWQSDMMDHVGKGIGLVGTDQPWDGGEEAWERTQDFQSQMIDFLISKTGTVGELVAGAMGHVRTTGLHSDVTLSVQDASATGPLVITAGHRASVIAAAAGDTITGNTGDDMLIGLGGIDHLSGGGGHDRIAGNDGNDILEGGPGNDELSGGGGDDFIDGGEGVDVAMYTGKRADFSFSKIASGRTKLTGPLGTDELAGIERLRFSDMSLAFDMQGNAGMAARLIGAILGRDFLKVPALVGKVIGLLDKGTSTSELVSLALHQQAVISLAGAGSGSISNDQLVSLLYRNLAGVEPSPEVKSNFVGLLDQGKHTPVSLVLLAAEHQVNAFSIDLVGLSDNGLSYLEI